NIAKVSSRKHGKTALHHALRPQTSFPCAVCTRESLKCADLRAPGCVERRGRRSLGTFGSRLLRQEQQKEDDQRGQNDVQKNFYVTDRTIAGDGAGVTID